MNSGKDLPRMSSPDFSPNSLRDKFLRFFEARGHKIIAPSSLVPENDPTVLFTTAGMHPLVPYLTGEAHPEGRRLCNIQPCFRTDDIEEVGDTYHHTFFEMMGSWSLGDYWKEDAIKWSFEFLTQELGIDKSKIAASVFEGDSDAQFDQESFKIWRNLGLAEARIAKLPKKDNWWGPAGKTGPCGPDTEIFVWVGEGGAPEEFDPKNTNWVEIWNDVFMEFERKLKVEGLPAGKAGEKLKENSETESEYEFVPLKQKNVDTGMGFERILAVLQGTDDNYRTELFWPIIQRIEEISGKRYPLYCHSEVSAEESCQRSFRIIADHIKAAVFILNAGIAPSNKLQGYVLRRLIRRAIVKGKQIGIEKNFCADLTDAICHSDAPAEKSQRSSTNACLPVGMAQGDIKSELEKEESRFRKTLAEGLVRFERTAGVGSMLTGASPMGMEYYFLSGKELFDLYQTYGFPLELSLEIAKEKNTSLSENYQKEYNEEFKKHQEISRAGVGRFRGGLADNREETTRLHTAAHLLHAALRKVLGDHVLQKGSNITAERLRFDFSHPERLSDEQIKKVEDLVNEQIERNVPVTMEEMTVDEARKSGALGVFDDRYGNKVKVYIVDDPSSSSGQVFSREICGGPHAKSTGALGRFKITNETSSSAGTRRIKATLI